MKGWEGGEGAHALLRISPLSPSHLAVIITQQPRARGERESEKRLLLLSAKSCLLTHSGRQAAAKEGKGNMRARSQFAILWSYQMRTEGEGGRGRNIYRPRCIQSARPSTTHGRLRAPADRRDVRTEVRAVSLSFPNSSRPRGKSRSCASETLQVESGAGNLV